MKTLKIHTLEKGWCDKDAVLLHAAFQILVDFVEQERPGERIDWNSDELHAHTWKEIRDLYRWWTKERPARKDPLDDKRLKIPEIEFKEIPGADLLEMVEPDRRKYAAYYRALEKSWELEQQWEEEDQRNLHRLVDIRAALWT